MKKMYFALVVCICMAFVFTGIVFASEYDVEHMTPDEMKEAITVLESEKTELEEQVKDLKAQLFDFMHESEKEKAQKKTKALDAETITFELEDGTELLNLDNVDSASVISRIDPNTGDQEYMVEVIFDESGKDVLEKATTEHVGELLIIAIDGEIISAPFIRSPVSDGMIVISGNFTQESAEDLAEFLNQ